MVNIISSLENHTIKHITKLIENKSYRQKNSSSVIYGEKTILSAYEYDVITDIFVKEEEYEKYSSIFNKNNISWHIIDKQNIFDKINPLNIDYNLFALIKQQNNKDLKEFYHHNCIILDNIQDPGNLGTIFRTAQASGIQHIILSNGCADIYNPKVLRSTMGIQFALNLIQNVDIEAFIIEYIKFNGTVLACIAKATKSIYSYRFKEYKNLAFIFGNEGHGISKNILEITSDNLYIPMHEKAESINVATAVAVTLYELYRQLNSIQFNDKL
jgi:TrmH family RNA methyltransferase